LQRKRRKRNCEKRRKNFDAIDWNHYLCNPNEKEAEVKRRKGEERRGRESKGNEIENKMSGREKR
jgi:hypothetical protein